MGNIESRVKSLETKFSVDTDTPVLVILTQDDNEAREAEIERVKSEYRESHPDRKGNSYFLFEVIDQETKEALDDYLKGEE